eukprot:4926851-Ditylum_brightwellii.AAC.1
MAATYQPTEHPSQKSSFVVREKIIKPKGTGKREELLIDWKSRFIYCLQRHKPIFIPAINLYRVAGASTKKSFSKQF